MDAMLEGGFADAVMEAQTAFRAILDALANPGTRQNLVLSPSTGARIGAELVSALLTLSDHDTPVWLAPELASDSGVREFIGFHTGAPLVGEPERAVFAFASRAGDLPPLAQFALGTQDYPDRSTTIVLQVEALEGGAPLTLRGPGIKDHRHISPLGLPEDFLVQWSGNRALFPRGVDLLFVAGGQVMGLPRATRIEEGH